MHQVKKTEEQALSANGDRQIKAHEARSMSQI